MEDVRNYQFDDDDDGDFESIDSLDEEEDEDEDDDYLYEEEKETPQRIDFTTLSFAEKKEIKLEGKDPLDEPISSDPMIMGLGNFSVPFSNEHEESISFGRVEEWSVERVCNFVEFEMKLPQYRKNFSSKKVDGKTLFSLSMNQLHEDLNIQKFDDIILVSRFIFYLKRKNALNQRQALRFNELYSKEAQKKGLPSSVDELQESHFSQLDVITIEQEERLKSLLLQHQLKNQQRITGMKRKRDSNFFREFIDSSSSSSSFSTNPEKKMKANDGSSIPLTSSSSFSSSSSSSSLNVNVCLSPSKRKKMILSNQQSSSTTILPSSSSSSVQVPPGLCFINSNSSSSSSSSSSRRRNDEENKIKSPIKKKKERKIEKKQKKIESPFLDQKRKKRKVFDVTQFDNISFDDKKNIDLNEEEQEEEQEVLENQFLMIQKEITSSEEEDDDKDDEEEEEEQKQEIWNQNGRISVPSPPGTEEVDFIKPKKEVKTKTQKDNNTIQPPPPPSSSSLIKLSTQKDKEKEKDDEDDEDDDEDDDGIPHNRKIEDFKSAWGEETSSIQKFFMKKK